jgi:hypothetical protein
MRFPRHLLQVSTFRAEPLMAAMAAVAIGMFVGAWLLGPAVTHDTITSAQPAQERTSFDAMVTRPDPPPYRTATPAFDVANAPNYAEAAKAKAQAALGGEVADDDTPRETPRSSGWSSRYYPKFDRHKVY